MNPLVSIITPFYQSEKFIASAIASVIDQLYQNWELLLINDGSTDRSKEIASRFQDSRIKYFEQENKGVAAARNLGLKHMSGEYFCFLDADDVLPKSSLLSRLKVFDQQGNAQFVDGVVYKMDKELTTLISIWKPNYSGEPLKDLVRLSGKSFFGNTWMIKRDKNKSYSFQENLFHGEDLYFYLVLAKEGGDYAFTNEVVLHYRNSPGSAMKNLKGLEKGYRFIESELRTWKNLQKFDFILFKIKYRKAMFLAYLRGGQFLHAIKSTR